MMEYLFRRSPYILPPFNTVRRACENWPTHSTPHSHPSRLLVLLLLLLLLKIFKQAERGKKKPKDYQLVTAKFMYRDIKKRGEEEGCCFLGLVVNRMCWLWGVCRWWMNRPLTSSSGPVRCGGEWRDGPSSPHRTGTSPFSLKALGSERGRQECEQSSGSVRFCIGGWGGGGDQISKYRFSGLKINWSWSSHEN